MGRKLVLTGTKLTDLAAPKLTNIDPVEAPGSLLLLDPTHPAGAWAAGVPANSSASVNLFNTNAKTVMGVTTDSHGSWTVGTGWDGTKGKLERTGKGGLHGVMSLTLGDSNTKAMWTLPDNLKTHLLNSGHEFFFSTWYRATRVAVSGGTSLLNLQVPNVSPTNNYLARQQGGSNVPGNGRVGAAALGNQISNLTAPAWVGTKPTGLGTFVSTLMILGFDGVFNYTDALARNSGSRIYYRTYIEDLTVSGRSYAQADAVDYAEYTKHVLTPGGRYYADTFTDPATLA